MFPLEIFRLIGLNSYRVWKLLQLTCHDLADILDDFHKINDYKFYSYAAPVFSDISYDEYSRLLAVRQISRMCVVYCYKRNFEYSFNITSDTECTSITIGAAYGIYRRITNRDGMIALAVHSDDEYKRLSDFIRDEFPAIASKFTLYIDNFEYF